MTTITHDKPYINCQLKDQGYYGSWKKKKGKPDQALMNLIFSGKLSKSSYYITLIHRHQIQAKMTLQMKTYTAIFRQASGIGKSGLFIK